MATPFPQSDMKISPLDSESVRLLLTLGLSLLCPFSSTAGLPEAEPPFTVLEEQQTIAADGHRTIVRRVLPPSVAPIQYPETEPNTSEAEGDSKPTYVLSVSCTVYHREGEAITELRWGKNRQHHAFSNIDFLDLAGAGQFQTPQASYQLIFGIGKGEVANRAANEVAVPASNAFNGTHAHYLLIQAGTPANETEADLVAMDALHAFYDANKALLKNQRTAREAENLRLQQEHLLKQQQPRPDTIIHIWPVSSSQPAN